MIYPDLELEIPRELGTVHFVGIGGSGMSGIARMMHDAGARVSGSDRSANYITKALEEIGIPVIIGHSADNLGDVDTVVVTGALWEDNPEYQEALRRGIPVLHRSHALKWLSSTKRVISVAGAHGKTTSTGMLTVALKNLGADPSFVNGGIIEQLGTSSGSGSDDLFVIEADESDKSFLIYDTAISLITNVDPEHLDFYGSEEAFMQAFVDFAEGSSERVVISADDPGAQLVGDRIPSEKRFTFGFSKVADLRIESIEASGLPILTLAHGGQRASAQLRVFGRYNAVNAAGVVAVLLVMGYELEDALTAVSLFEGTKRRLEFHGEYAGVRLFDDYAHHPTEVEALLGAAKQVAQGGRIIAVHQPHLYSRTQTFAREFAEVLEAGADYSIVLDVDGAREDPVPGVTGLIVAEKFTDQGRVRYEPDWERAAAHLAEVARPGDIAITMSCGIVYQIIPQLQRALEDAVSD